MITLALDIASTAAILFIVSAGLLIVFGVMKIVNFAHGAFITLGGYAALVASQLGLPWLLSPLVAFATALAAGALIEAVIVRRLYDRKLDAILATWGLGIVLGQLITLTFGRGVQFVPAQWKAVTFTGGLSEAFFSVQPPVSGSTSARCEKPLPVIML